MLDRFLIIVNTQLIVEYIINCSIINHLIYNLHTDYTVIRAHVEHSSVSHDETKMISMIHNSLLIFIYTVKWKIGSKQFKYRPHQFRQPSNAIYLKEVEISALTQILFMKTKFSVLEFCLLLDN